MQMDDQPLDDVLRRLEVTLFQQIGRLIGQSQRATSRRSLQLLTLTFSERADQFGVVRVPLRSVPVVPLFAEACGDSQGPKGMMTRWANHSDGLRKETLGGWIAHTQWRSSLTQCNS